MAVDPATVIKGVQAGASIISGLKGLFGGGKRRVSEAEKAQLKNLEQRQALYNEILQNARDYNPEAELDKAMVGATNATRKNLREELISLNTEFRNAGGVPKNDTLFNVSETDIAARNMEALTNFSTNARLQFASNRASMLMSALNAGGDLMGSWEAIRNQGLVAQGQAGLSLASGIDALRSILGPTEGVGGSGAGKAASGVLKNVELGGGQIDSLLQRLLGKSGGVSTPPSYGNGGARMGVDKVAP